MNRNIRIAKQLVRIARILVAFNRNELEKQLKQKRSDLNEESLKEHLDCLEKMDAKEQKVALYWINKKSLTLPEDLSTFNNAMNLIKKQHLDFQKFDNPTEVLNRDDKSTLRIRSQDEVFNPSTEKTFSHPYNAGDGVIIYNVEDSKEGQLAVRRAIDFHFGYDKNFWCLATRYEKYDDDLEEAWNYWKENSAYPKRIAFKNGKLLAFSAGKKKQHVEWWDRNDKSHYDIPESNAVDDVEFLKKYGKLNLLENNASPEIIEELAEDKDKYLREEVAKHPNTPADILRKLAEDEGVDVRYEVVRNPNTPVDILIKLAEDVYGGVREEVAKHPNTPADILRKLAEDKDLGVIEGVVHNPNTPADIFRKLAGDKHSGVRRAVAENPNTTADILRKLADDKDAFVKYGVAMNPKIPADILRKLADDGNDDVRRAVAENLNTPVEILMKLVDNNSTRNGVARNPNTPVEILRKLAEDNSDRVRKEVAINPKIPVDILTKLAEDDSYRVRQFVTINPNTPVEILRKLAEDKDAFVRYGVAINPNTPVEILRKLAEDEDLGVREYAESQLQTREQ